MSDFVSRRDLRSHSLVRGWWTRTLEKVHHFIDNSKEELKDKDLYQELVKNYTRIVKTF